jgi:hypothetical protein
MEQRKNLRFHVKFRSSFSSIGIVGGEGTLVDLSIREPLWRFGSRP